MLSSLMPERVENRGATGQDCDIFHHGLAAIAVPGALTAQQVKVPRRRLITRVAQCFAIDIFSDDQQWLTLLNHLL